MRESRGEKSKDDRKYTNFKLRLRLFWLKMDSGKQFTPYRVFGYAWKIWLNGKSFPLTIKYPPHTRKSFYTLILPSNHFHSPQKIYLLTHSHHSRQAQAEGRRELSPVKPRCNPQPTAPPI